MGKGVEEWRSARALKNRITGNEAASNKYFRSNHGRRCSDAVDG